MIGDNERLEHRFADRALLDNPLYAIFEKYHFSDVTSPEVLDNLLLSLNELPTIAKLKTELEEAPAYTTVFHFDPRSVHTIGGEGCFNYPTSLGATTAYARVFQDLSPDAIKVVRTENEALIVIDQPATLIGQDRPATKVLEPTVLFTSRQLHNIGSSSHTAEELLLGLTITHGDSPLGSLPDPNLVPGTISDQVIKMTRKLYAAQS